MHRITRILLVGLCSACVGCTILLAFVYTYYLLYVSLALLVVTHALVSCGVPRYHSLDAVQTMLADKEVPHVYATITVLMAVAWWAGLYYLYLETRGTTNALWSLLLDIVSVLVLWIPCVWIAMTEARKTLPYRVEVYLITMVPMVANFWLPYCGLLTVLYYTTAIIQTGIEVDFFIQ